VRTDVAWQANVASSFIGPKVVSAGLSLKVVTPGEPVNSARVSMKPGADHRPHGLGVRIASAATRTSWSN